MKIKRFICICVDRFKASADASFNVSVKLLTAQMAGQHPSAGERDFSKRMSDSPDFETDIHYKILFYIAPPGLAEGEMITGSCSSG